MALLRFIFAQLNIRILDHKESARDQSSYTGPMVDPIILITLSQLYCHGNGTRIP